MCGDSMTTCATESVTYVCMCGDRSGYGQNQAAYTEIQKQSEDIMKRMTSPQESTRWPEFAGTVARVRWPTVSGQRWAFRIFIELTRQTAPACGCALQLPIRCHEAFT